MKHTVLNHINEQPVALKRVFDQRNDFVESFLDIFKNRGIRKILFFGSGTSYNASLLAVHYFKRIAGIDAEFHYPTVFQNYEKADWSGQLKNEEVLFFGISQSGTSISTVNLMKEANSNGFNTIALTENLNSIITEHVDCAIPLLSGKEYTPPETKGYTGTALTLYLMAIYLAKELNSISNEEFTTLLEDAHQMINHFDTYLHESELWYERNKCLFINSYRINFVGYGIDFASTLEATLKVGEMFRYPTHSFELEEYVHGHTMSLNPKQSIVIFGSDEVEWDRMMHFRDIFLKYTDRVHLISYKQFDCSTKDVVFSNATNKFLGPLIFTLPIQFLAAKGAQDIGIDTSIHPFNEGLGHFNKFAQ